MIPFEEEFKSEDIMRCDVPTLSKNNRILRQNADLFPADSKIMHIMLINESESWILYHSEWSAVLLQSSNCEMKITFINIRSEMALQNLWRYQRGIEESFSRLLRCEQ